MKLFLFDFPPWQTGFGNIDGEYWLGLENIYWLTNQGTYKLLVMLEDWSGRKTFAEYASFRLESEADFYKLRVGRYHGNAGDSLTWHNGKQFTTLDRDHDVYTGEHKRISASDTLIVRSQQRFKACTCLQVNHRIAYMNVVSLMVYCHSYCCPLIVKGTLKSSIPDNLWGFFKH